MHKLFLEKHKRYKDKYGKNELYWGFGIENEMYLQFDKKIKINKEYKLKPERYSIDYFKSYKNNINLFNNINFDLDIPLLVNSHSFLYTDENNEHETTYENEPQPNKKYNGICLHELLMKNDYFSSHHDIDFVYDGDTIEFITQNFYKTSLQSVITELKTIKKDFIDNIQPIFPFKEYGKISLMEQNYPFAIHLTNLKNIAIFNNGTYHFNFTLPTQLDEYGEIKDINLFIKEHQNAIRILQLFEPIFIALYGSSDPFYPFSASQRCSMSRYIGIGTYDTEKMKTGKILHIDTKELHNYFWYNLYHKDSVYQKLDKIGLDINFNKHHYHGIEFRIFDYIPNDNDLLELLEFIINLLDHSLEFETIDNIVKTKQWNELTVNCIRHGKKTLIPSSQLFLFNELFSINLKHPISIINFFNIIKNNLNNKYKKIGKFSKYINLKNNLDLDLDSELESVKIKKCCLIL